MNEISESKFDNYVQYGRILSKDVAVRAGASLKKRKYWYYISGTECVLCGRVVEYRERRYMKKPKQSSKRCNYEETACSLHFL